jgi:hypothetical protein
LNGGRGGQWENVTIPGDRGVAFVEYDGELVESVCILRWPPHLLTHDKNREGTFFRSKSGTLETVGLLLPFITNPEQLVGKHIVLGVDNTSVVYAWHKRYSKRDPETSLIRVLHVIEAYLHCT